MAAARNFVYVSNAADGDIATFSLQPDGALKAGARAKAADVVGPLAVSPDRRFLYAAVRSKPYAVHVYAIDPVTGALRPHSVSPLAESFPYIALDKSGRWLLGASYHANLVSLNAVGDDGHVASAPRQVIPVGRNAHSIRTDESNRYVYVPTLGSDQIFQFAFDASAGKLCSNTPAVVQLAPGAGPRHFVTSSDNRYLYMLSELLATVTTFALDAETGLLTEIGSASGLPPNTRLAPGTPRVAVGASSSAPPRNREQDIWAADIHLTPDGRFIYISERTSSSLGALGVNAQSGELSYLGSVPTEAQPRGFAIAPDGRFLVACGEKSETISVHAIDQASGALSMPRQYPGGRGANWVEIVGFG